MPINDAFWKNLISQLTQSTWLLRKQAVPNIYLSDLFNLIMDYPLTDVLLRTCRNVLFVINGVRKII